MRNRSPSPSYTYSPHRNTALSASRQVADLIACNISPPVGLFTFVSRWSTKKQQKTSTTCRAAPTSAPPTVPPHNRYHNWPTFTPPINRCTQVHLNGTILSLLRSINFTFNSQLRFLYHFYLAKIVSKGSPLGLFKVGLDKRSFSWSADVKTRSECYSLSSKFLSQIACIWSLLIWFLRLFPERGMGHGS